MKIKAFKALYPKAEQISSPDEFFNSTSERYSQFREQGFFTEADAKAFYIYHISGKNSHSGIFVENSISDFKSGKIKGHENTILSREKMLIQLTEKRKALIKPVLLTYRDNPQINELLNKISSEKEPIYSVYLNESGETHSLIQVTQPDDILQISKLFEELIPNAYIADGHHRSATLTEMLDKKYGGSGDEDNIPGILCGYFPFSELKIYDFSRIVDFSIKMTTAQFIATIFEFFNVEKMVQPEKPTQKHQLTLFLNQQYYRLEWKSPYLNSESTDDLLLDVSLFNKYILDELVDVNELRSGNALRFIGGEYTLPQLLNSASEGLAVFNFFPVNIEDIVTTSDAGKTLPPKSTWFEPRMKNGLIVREF